MSEHIDNVIKKNQERMDTLKEDSPPSDDLPRSRDDVVKRNLKRIEERKESQLHTASVQPAGVQQKLDQVRTMLKAKKNELEFLQRSRAEEAASLSPNLRTQERLDGEIVACKQELERLPFTIVQLEGQVKEAKEANAVENEMHTNFMTEISLAEMQRKSRLLLSQLRSALKTNDMLLGFYRLRADVEKQTDRPIAVPAMCGGFQSLKVLVEMCEQENNGGGRKATRWSNLPIEDLI